jgi:hypothetical protein
LPFTVAPVSAANCPVRVAATVTTTYALPNAGSKPAPFTIASVPPSVALPPTASWS